MNSTNYIAGIVKILESPQQKVSKNDTITSQFKGQLPQLKSTLIVNLTFWGNLARDITTYYKVGDYIMIEGYISLRTDQVTSDLISLKRIELTVLKVYPLYSTLDYSNSLTKETLEYEM